MAYLDIKQIKQELVVFVRNQDIFTTTQRAVTTTSATGTFSADSDLVIDVTNIKNIRSVTVGGVLLSFGSDYQVDYMYLDTTIKCKITFTVAQTGAYTIPYDYGADKIFPDFPKTKLSISSFPRIAVDIISMQTSPGGFGNVYQSIFTFTVVVYDKTISDLTDYITKIRTVFIENRTSFYYMNSLVNPLSLGPLITMPLEKGKDKIMQQNIDFESVFNYEKN